MPKQLHFPFSLPAVAPKAAQKYKKKIPLLQTERTERTHAGTADGLHGAAMVRLRRSKPPEKKERTDDDLDFAAMNAIEGINHWRDQKWSRFPQEICMKIELVEELSK